MRNATMSLEELALSWKGLAPIHHAYYNVLPVIGIDETKERGEKGGGVQHRRIDQDAEDRLQCAFRGTGGHGIALHVPDSISKEP